MSAEESNAESKYEVREVIGKGAFGEVNLVVEKQSKQRYVLKRIKMARQSEWQRKATRQEIEIVSRLRHPFIMPYKEHWTHHGHTINVVYGYCEKGDLTSAITKQKGKFFSEETLRLWLAELLLAVDYMHRQNVLHRDIKTQNILLTGDGDVQIGDFGLSTVRVPSMADISQQQQPGGDDTDPRMDSSPAHLDVGSGGGGTAAATPEPAKGGGGHHHHAIAMVHVQANPAGAEAYTNGLAHAHANGHNGPGDKDKDQLAGHTPVHDPKAGTRNDYALVGTPHFMSPELLSSQKYSYETDIWSLGVVMYELTTLKPPFNAFNLAGLVAKIKRAALPPIPPSYSADWTAILKSMLRKDPTRRAAPLELLAIPSMQQALQQARQRALTILPDFVMPEIPVLDTGINSAGFCFDVAPAPAAAAAPGGGAGLQRTPSAAGPSTPVLINPLAAGGGAGDDGGGEDGGGGADLESSPLSKFPDLGSAAESPLPAAPVPAAGAAAPSAAAPPTFADTNRSKTPATARRPGGAAGPAPGAAGAAAAANAAAAAAAKRAVSPQRTRAPPVFGGAQRSKTPGRAYGGATAVATKADVARKPATARERPRSVINTAVATSPRNVSGGGVATAAAAEIGAPATARAASPTDAADRQPARKAGPSSGPAPRVSAIGAFRHVGGGGRRSLLDAVGGQQQGLPATLSVPATAHDIDASDATSPGSLDATAGKAASSPPSTGGHKSSSPAAGGGGGAGSRPAPWRARSVSVNTARTSRASLAGGSPPSQSSPRGGDAAANGHHHHHHQTVSARRLVSVARGGSADPTSAAAAAAAAAGAATVVLKRGGPVTAAGADAAKRAGAATEAMPSARARNTSSPPSRANAATGPANTAAAAAAAASAAARRRSQPGTTAASKDPPTDAAAAAAATAARQPEKRVRRSSFVSYGKPADSAPLQRRPPSSSSSSAQAHASLATSRDSAPAGAVRAAAKGPLPGPLSSHPLAASDVALDSCPASANCSPSGQHPELSRNGSGPSEVGVAGPPAPGGAGSAEELLLSSTSNLVAAGVGAGGGLEGELSEAAAAAAGGGGGGGHPWRQTPRSRSLRSMATEDSELSIPDGSRYGPSETNGGAVYDGEMGAAAAAFAVAASPGRAAAFSIAAINPIGQPLWSCNQLYSGSYGSCAGSLNDMGAHVGASAAVGAAAPQGGSGSARGPEAAGLGAAAATLAVDLPRRVSASAFAPHLLGSYGSAAAAAAATAAGDGAAGGTDSEASTPVEAQRGAMRGTALGLRRLTLNESVEAAAAAGDGPMQLVSPSRFDLVSSSPAAAGIAADGLSPMSSTAASPQSGVYGGVRGGGMEIASPTAAAMPPPRRHGGGSVNSSFNAQQQQPHRRSGRALDAHASGGIGSHLDAVLSKRYSGEYDASPLGSTVSAVQRALAAQQQGSADEATASAGPAPADSCSEVTSQLRPVAEEGDGEAESAQQQQPRTALTRGGGAASTGRDLSASERAQLALLQRVVSLAGSLWEMGREEELGAVLSSTLSRPLVRCRPGTAAAAAAAASSGLSEARSGASASEQLSPSGSLRQRRAPEPGDAVRVTAGPLRGSEAVVRYRGPCHWGAGIVLGLELPQAKAAGPGDLEEPPGCRDGVRYFRCHQPRAGAAFLGVDQVTLLVD